MGVYEILAIASPIMGLLAFGCAQAVIAIFLRRKFAPHASDVPLQRRLQLGLYVFLVVCTCLWAYGFVICARAVWFEIVRGDLLPLLLFLGVVAAAFAGLVIVSWFAVRQRTENLTRLSAELQALSGDDTSGAIEPADVSLPPMAIRPVTEKARHAVLFLGASSYRATLEALQRAESRSS